MTKNNKILIFIGKSGSGKDTFYEKTIEKYDINKITLLTTRPMRPKEQDGREYFFVSQEKMDALEERNQLIEIRKYQVTGNQCWTYATEKSQIDLEHSNYLTLNTWLGYERFLQFFPKENVLPFYFELDDGIRLQRGLDREIQTGNRNFEELCRRFLSDQIDFKEEYLKLYNPIIINNNGTIEETMDQIDNALKRELNLLPKEKFR